MNLKELVGIATVHYILRSIQQASAPVSNSNCCWLRYTLMISAHFTVQDHETLIMKMPARGGRLESFPSVLFL